MPRLDPTVSQPPVSAPAAPVSGAAAMAAITLLAAAFGTSTTRNIVGKVEQRADTLTFVPGIEDAMLGPATLAAAATVRAAFADPRCSVPHKADPSRSAPARHVLGVMLGYSTATVNPEAAAIGASYTGKRPR